MSGYTCVWWKYFLVESLCRSSNRMSYKWCRKDLETDETTFPEPKRCNIAAIWRYIAIVVVQIQYGTTRNATWPCAWRNHRLSFLRVRYSRLKFLKPSIPEYSRIFGLNVFLKKIRKTRYRRIIRNILEYSGILRIIFCIFRIILFRCFFKKYPGKSGRIFPIKNKKISGKYWQNIPEYHGIFSEYLSVFSRIFFYSNFLDFCWILWNFQIIGKILKYSVQHYEMSQKKQQKNIPKNPGISRDIPEYSAEFFWIFPNNSGKYWQNIPEYLGIFPNICQYFSE